MNLDYLLLVVDRACIPELYQVRKLYLTNSVLRKEFEDILFKNLSTIARVNNLNIVTSFKDLYFAYKRQKMERRVRHKPKTWSLYYLNKGSLDALEFAIQVVEPDCLEGETFLEKLSKAAGIQSLALVEKFFSITETHTYFNLGHVISSAIRAGNDAVIDYILLLDKCEYVYEEILNIGAELGDMGWIHMALHNEPFSDFALRYAAKGGNKRALDFIQTKINSPCELLQGYTLAGNADMVNQLLSTQIFTEDEIWYAYCRACDVRNKELIELFRGLLSEYYLDNMLSNEAEYGLEAVQNIFEYRKWTKGELEDALALAIDYEQVEVIQFLLSHGAKTDYKEDIMTRLLEGELN